MLFCLAGFQRVDIRPLEALVGQVKPAQQQPPKFAVFSNQTLPVYPEFVCRFFELDEEKLPKPSEFDLFKL
jgi:hypothetical protein